ncbi:coenzyme A transporter [Blastocladiella emersonii ATCC 22665]|nr:coenzyme A transporter [Blastocladiella emersonii ATCC 22665]
MSLDFAWKSFAAGGIAGCAAKSVVAPLDRVKILFQTNSPAFAHHRGSFQGMLRAAGEIKARHGVYGLFQGHSATLIRIFPYAAIKFMAVEQYNHLLFPKDGSKPSPLLRFAAGSLAGVTSVFMTYPLEVVRVRLAFSNDPHSLRALLGKMYRERPHVGAHLPVLGQLSNFYRGFLPTVYGMIPYAGVSFMVYDLAKQRLHGVAPEWSPSAVHLVAGGLAGAISQTVSYPLEVIRRRMQVGGHYHVESYEARVYRTTAETARHIYSLHGLRGFFVGLSIGYVKVVPMSMVSFWTYEACKVLFGIGSDL